MSTVIVFIDQLELRKVFIDERIETVLRFIFVDRAGRCGGIENHALLAVVKVSYRNVWKGLRDYSVDFYPHPKITLSSAIQNSLKEECADVADEILDIYEVVSV